MHVHDGYNIMVFIAVKHNGDLNIISKLHFVTVEPLNMGHIQNNNIHLLVSSFV